MSGFRPVRFRHDDALTRVSWQEFERLIAEHFRQLGYEVEHTGTGDGTNRTDGGIDLKLRRDQETILVQCKHWTAFQVPHNAVHVTIGGWMSDPNRAARAPGTPASWAGR